MAKDYSKEIESKRVLIATTISKMNKLRNDFIIEIEPFAIQWIYTIARQYIERNPEIALKLGKERLILLKKNVQKLAEDIKSICIDVFSNDKFWPETRELITQNQLGIKIILGKLGTILEEFGFVKTKAQTEGDKESWNQYDSDGNRREFDGTTIYPHSIEIPSEIKNLLEDYRKLIQTKNTLMAEIKNLEFENLQTQATTLWDSI